MINGGGGKSRFERRMKVATSVLVFAVLIRPEFRSQSLQRMSFESISVKPSIVSRSNPTPEDVRSVGLQFLPRGRFRAHGVPFQILLEEAYKPQLMGGGSPEFNQSHDRSLERNMYDIDAVAGADAIPASLPAKIRNQRMREMLQSLLVERFKLKVHVETREVPVYTLVLSKNGAKLRKAAVSEKDCADAAMTLTMVLDAASCHSFSVRSGPREGLNGRAVDMNDLAAHLSGPGPGLVGRPVVNKTALDGLYDIQTSGWSPGLPPPLRPDEPNRPNREDQSLSNASNATIFGVLSDLGLTLESQTGKVDFVVIDHAEPPSPN